MTDSFSLRVLHANKPAAVRATALTAASFAVLGDHVAIVAGTAAMAEQARQVITTIAAGAASRVTVYVGTLPAHAFAALNPPASSPLPAVLARPLEAVGLRVETPPPAITQVSVELREALREPREEAECLEPVVLGPPEPEPVAPAIDVERDGTSHRASASRE